MRARALAMALFLTSACSEDTAPPETLPSEPAAEDTAPPETLPSEPVAIAGSDSGVDITESQQPLPRPTARRELPRRLGALVISGNKVADLSDGRSLVIGQSPEDDPVISTSRRQTQDGLADPITRSDPPIRLFVVDWETQAHAAVSGFPESHTMRNATGEHGFAEVVLEFEVEPGEQTVRYSSGWNGAGYDIPYSLWIAPVPQTS